MEISLRRVPYPPTETLYSYRSFWKPIANNLGDTKKIYFSPDGVYSQVSLYTLLNPETKKFLIDEIDLHIITNTKDLTVAKSAAPVDEVEKSLLFGFPNYNLGVIENDPNRQQLASDIATAASLGRGDSREVRGSRGGNGDVDPAALAFIGNNNTGAGLSRGLRGNLQRYMSGNNLMALLPGTKVEVESISTIFQNLERESGLFTGNEATEQELKTITNPRTLHIATHGFFLENEKLAKAGGEQDNYVENPLLRSGLIMAGANSFIAAGQISEEHEDGEDGILTAYEAMNLNLSHTDLVVLSACETGLGEISNGEGVYGLQRAFQVAGAKNIIMSMWTVDDAATQELMTAFYSEWVKTGDRQKAFVTAQRQIKAKYKYPYFWGAFVMIGE
jgi:CHAT domain-containing protein